MELATTGSKKKMSGEEAKKWMAYLFNNNSCAVSELVARGWPHDKPAELLGRIQKVIEATKSHTAYSAGSTAEGVDPKKHYAIEGRPRAEYTHLIWAVAQTSHQANYLKALKKAGFTEVTQFKGKALTLLIYPID